MNPAYIFVREDGRVFKILGEPFPEDFEHAKAGLQTIIRTTDHASYGVAGEWLPIPDGIVAPQESQEILSPLYHAPKVF